MTDVYNYAEQPSFLERLSVLAGKTSYRIPVEGRSSQVKAIPVEHSIAIALAYAREGGDDIGPDMAYDMATASYRHRTRIVRTVAEAIKKDRHCRPVRRNRHLVHLACEAAYQRAHNRSIVFDAPLGTNMADWEFLIEASYRIMQSMAESAVRRAEQAFFRKGVASFEKV